MKLLHTSDWHVGRTIRGRSRADEHRAVLAEIVDVAAREQVDVVLVAGDQFDVAAPSPESEQIVYRALLDLAATGAEVVVLAGNHDNARRWSAVRPLLDLSSIHLSSAVAPPDRGGVLDLVARDGETLRLALLPWLSQRGVVTAEHLMTQDAAQQQQEFAARMRRIVGVLTAGFAADVVNALVGHVTCLASAVPPQLEGERATHVLDYAVPPGIFGSEAQYVALGHLHRAHQVPGPAPVHYCGAPLALDFGEAAGRGGSDPVKQVNVVEVTAGRPAAVRAVPLSAGTPLRTLRGTAEQVRAQAGAHDDAHLRLVLEETPRVGLGDEFRALFPTAVDVLLDPPDREDAEEDDWALDHFQASPTTLFTEYLDATGQPDERLVARFSRLLDEHHDHDRREDDHASAPA